MTDTIDKLTQLVAKQREMAAIDAEMIELQRQEILALKTEIETLHRDNRALNQLLHGTEVAA